MTWRSGHAVAAAGSGAGRGWGRRVGRVLARLRAAGRPWTCPGRTPPSWGCSLRKGARERGAQVCESEGTRRACGAGVFCWLRGRARWGSPGGWKAPPRTLTHRRDLLDVNLLGRAVRLEEAAEALPNLALDLRLGNPVAKRAVELLQLKVIPIDVLQAHQTRCVSFNTRAHALSGASCKDAMDAGRVFQGNARRPHPPYPQLRHGPSSGASGEGARLRGNRLSAPASPSRQKPQARARTIVLQSVRQPLVPPSATSLLNVALVHYPLSGAPGCDLSRVVDGL